MIKMIEIKNKYLPPSFFKIKEAIWMFFNCINHKITCNHYQYL